MTSLAVDRLSKAQVETYRDAFSLFDRSKAGKIRASDLFLIFQEFDSALTAEDTLVLVKECQSHRPPQDSGPNAKTSNNKFNSNSNKSRNHHSVAQTPGRGGSSRFRSATTSTNTGHNSTGRTGFLSPLKTPSKRRSIMQTPSRRSSGLGSNSLFSPARGARRRSTAAQVSGRRSVGSAQDTDGEVDIGTLMDETYLEFPDFIEVMVKMNPPSASAAKDEVKDCFELFDVNGNGVVTTTGFTDTLMRLGQEASEEEAKEMMAMMKKISGKANKYASNSKTNKDTESLNLKDFQNLYASLPQ